MNPVIKKLSIEKYQKVLILNAPDEFKPVIKEINAKVDTNINIKYPFILSFEKDLDNLNKTVPTLISALETNGQLWIAYPKGTSKLYKSDLNRDIIRTVFQHHKFDGVSLIAIDDNWSAMRVKPEELIKSGKR